MSHIFSNNLCTTGNLILWYVRLIYILCTFSKSTRFMPGTSFLDKLSPHYQQKEFKLKTVNMGFICRKPEEKKEEEES